MSRFAFTAGPELNTTLLSVISLARLFSNSKYLPPAAPFEKLPLDKLFVELIDAPLLMFNPVEFKLLML